MTIHEIPNIEHCTIEEMGNPLVAYRIRTNEGWYIHLNDGDEETANIYKTVAILFPNYNFEQVQIIAEADLPEGAEICGGVNNPEHETM